MEEFGKKEFSIERRREILGKANTKTLTTAEKIEYLRIIGETVAQLPNFNRKGITKPIAPECLLDVYAFNAPYIRVLLMLRTASVQQIQQWNSLDGEKTFKEAVGNLRELWNNLWKKPKTEETKAEEIKEVDNDHCATEA